MTRRFPIDEEFRRLELKRRDASFCDLDHPPVHPREAPRESAFGRWLRHHRLARFPGTIEVETGLLFIAPLIGNVWLLTAACLAAGANYVLASARLFVKLLRRASPPKPPAP